MPETTHTPEDGATLTGLGRIVVEVLERCAGFDFTPEGVVCRCGEALYPSAMTDVYAALNRHRAEVIDGEVDATEKVVYAVRYCDGEIDGTWTKPGPVRRFIGDIRKDIASGNYRASDYEPMDIVSRAVTKVPDLTSEWVPRNRDGGDRNA